MRSSFRVSTGVYSEARVHKLPRPRSEIPEGDCKTDTKPEVLVLFGEGRGWDTGRYREKGGGVCERTSPLYDPKSPAKCPKLTKCSG